MLELRIQPHRIVRRDGPAFTAVAVQLLDTALAVAAVAAHVELATRTCTTRHRIRSADHADHKIARREAASWRRFPDAAQRFVTQHQRPRFLWGPAVFPCNYLFVGAADADGEAVHQELTLGGGGLGYVRYRQRARASRFYGQCSHLARSTTRFWRGYPEAVEGPATGESVEPQPPGYSSSMWTHSQPRRRWLPIGTAIIDLAGGRAVQVGPITTANKH